MAATTIVNPVVYAGATRLRKQEDLQDMAEQAVPTYLFCASNDKGRAGNRHPTYIHKLYHMVLSTIVPLNLRTVCILIFNQKGYYI